MPTIRLSVTKMKEAPALNLQSTTKICGKGKNMGLAASQARFLAITSRKMNCEFQSMQIAQQKLSVTRDLQRAAQDYQNSLNATKLVWDCDTVDNDIYNLSYDLMMNPSAINEYDPYLITDTKGRIVLDNKTWDAAYEAGMINKYGDPKGQGTIEDRNTFMEELGKRGVVAPNIVSLVTSSEYTQAGVGGPIMDKTISSLFNTTAFIKYMKDKRYEEDIPDPADSSKILHKKGDYVYGLKLDSISSGTLKKDGPASFAEGDADLSYKIVQNGLVISDPSNLSLGDILSGNYTLIAKDDSRGSNFEKIAVDLLDQIAKVFGRGSTDKGLAVTDDARQALEAAYALTKIQYEASKYIPTSDASKCNTGIASSTKQYEVSISNMVNSFLTNFVIALEGFDCGLNIDKDSASKSNYVSKYPSYYFQIANADFPQENDLYADFYNQLYNQICMNGACNDALKREKVKDNTYLTNALKNGQLFVSTLNTDGYFYQGHYTASGHIAEVQDEDAIAQAEAEYNVTKAKLNNKEETLELQMKNLDMEISSLTTEYDTVKGLISKSVEKVFTMFST